MKKRNILAVLLLFLLSGRIISAQGSDSELKLSLKEAHYYAIQNNKMVLTAKKDVEAARIAVWETISNTLPQVSASGSFTDNLKLMTTLIPGDFFGCTRCKVPVTFGSSTTQVPVFRQVFSLFQCTCIYWN